MTVISSVIDRDSETFKANSIKIGDETRYRRISNWSRTYRLISPSSRIDPAVPVLEK